MGKCEQRVIIMNNSLISDDYLIHYGVKGMKWGVRRQERRAERNRRLVNREISYQTRKINRLEGVARAYEKSAKDIRSKGYESLRKQGYDDKTAKKAVKLTASRRDTEAAWNRHLANHYKDYNKRLSEIDINSMTSRQVLRTIKDLGDVKVKEINDTWKEPASTREYNKMKYSK